MPAGEKATNGYFQFSVMVCEARVWVSSPAFVSLMLSSTVSLPLWNTCNKVLPTIRLSLYKLLSQINEDFYTFIPYTRLSFAVYSFKKTITNTYLFHYLEMIRLTRVTISHHDLMLLNMEVVQCKLLQNLVNMLL